MQEAKDSEGKPAGVWELKITDKVAEDAGVRPKSKVLSINGQDIEREEYKASIKIMSEADFPKVIVLRGEKEMK